MKTISCSGVVDGGGRCIKSTYPAAQSAEKRKKKQTSKQNTHIMYIEMEDAIRNLTKANT